LAHAAWRLGQRRSTWCTPALARWPGVSCAGFGRSDFAAMNEIYRQYFKEGNYPARTTIVCPLANPDFLLEIECVAQAGAG
jgi:hypothetical protein